MRNFLISSAVMLTAMGSSFAADLPSRRAPPVYVAPAPIFTWTGSYVGVNAGYAFNTDHSFTTVGNTPAQATDIATALRPPFIRDRSSGFTGGGQIGYNYQFGGASFLGGGVVAGIEADAVYDGPSSSSTYTGGALVSRFTSRTDFVGTVRGRLGYAIGQFLLYGTGGFAYGNVHDSVAFFNAAGVNTFAGNRNSLRTGYTYGGGFEYALPTTSFVNFLGSSAVTLKVEYLRYDLGTGGLFVPSLTTGNSFTSSIRTQGNIVRAGLNYKVDFFGPSASSVVAKY